MKPSNADAPNEFPVPAGRLERDLQALWGPEGEESCPGDAVVFSEARAHFSRKRRLRMVRRVAGFAAAAGLALTLFLMRGPQSRGLELAVGLQSDPYDVDRNGAVDIVDALVLARALEQGRAAADLTGDGEVDRADVEALSARAVRLDR